MNVWSLGAALLRCRTQGVHAGDRTRSQDSFRLPQHVLNRTTRWVAVVLCVILSSCSQLQTQTPHKNPKGNLGERSKGRSGVVATSESSATQAGIRILQKGGNAIDAAAAVAFALNVVEPHSSGIGGGGFMMIYLSSTRQTVIVDSRETAPDAASPTMFLDVHGTPFAFDLISTSGISVGVPGMVRGIAQALSRWGTMSFADILAPAINLAREGFPITAYLENRIQEGLKTGRLSHEPGHPAYEVARSIFSPGGEPLRQGQVLIQPELMKTLQLLATQGPDSFYRGTIARAIVKTQQNARGTPNSEDTERLRGQMTVPDLESYSPVVRHPVEADYRGYLVQSMPPPSSGGLTILQILRMLERFPVGDPGQGFGPGSPRTLHVMLEAMRLAFADRALWMGDADTNPVPVKGLMHRDYLSTRSREIHLDHRTSFVTAGNPLPFNDSNGPSIAHLFETPRSTEEGTHTTHFTVMERDGNIVTYTNTIESEWGTGLMVPGYGFFLNNELTDFNLIPVRHLDPQHYNPGANDPAPGKRPRSSMAPTIIFHQGHPVAAYGSPGGATIINSVLSMTLNLIDHHMELQEAVDFPRLSQTTANGNPTLEPGFSETAIKELHRMGHTFSALGMNPIGSVQAIAINEATRSQLGAADRRRPGRVMTLH